MEKNTNRTTKNILAIETSGASFSLALIDSQGKEGILKGYLELNRGFRHSSILREGTRFLLNQSDLCPKDLDAIAVTLGPGSFTGLRVGISFVRALAQGLQIPLLGFSTFDVIAQSLTRRKTKEPSVILIDSIGEEVFASSHPTPLHWKTVCKKIKKKTILCGDGFLHHENEIKSMLRDLLIPISKDFHFPQARYLGELAAKKILRGVSIPKSWERAIPTYGRPPLVIERLQKEKDKGVSHERE